VEIIGVSGVIASYERLIGKDGINTIKDIEGKRVAYPPNSTAAYALEAAISVNKLDRSKITLLPLRPAEMVAAWKRGDIDAGYVWARLRRSWNPPAVIRSLPPKICKKMAT
jgi:taurine transport system substrate-binding protein